MASQLTKKIRHCRECLAFREEGPDGAHCAMNDKTFGTHPVDKAAPGWCVLRKMALVLEYKGNSKPFEHLLPHPTRALSRPTGRDHARPA